MGEWLNLALTLVFFGGIFWLAWRNRKSGRRSRPVADKPDQPYSVFTDQFDIELRGTDLRTRLMGASGDSARGRFEISKDHWQREVEAASAIYEAEQPSLAAAMNANTPSLAGSAVTILVDQSGSMKGEPMRYAAASARLLNEMLVAWGAKTEVLGFSTAGWQGGFARQKWIVAGRPKRPGRVCALLHIVYKSFAEPAFATDSWEAMLDPNVLRENVDGEAIEWAAARLRATGLEDQHLLIVSDGAPMDDATAASNGLNYLTRHLQQVLENLQADSGINIASIEIGHEGLYPRESAFFAPDPTNVSQVMLGWGCNLTKSAEAK